VTNGGKAIPEFPPPKRHPYDQWSPDARALDLVGDKWTLLIVRDLAAGPRRFVELQRVLPGISTEQLRSRLNRMVADGLLTRQRYREVPPRVDYELTERAAELMPVLGALARWGYDWTWSEPRAGEDVDVGAILRLAPGLLSPARSVRGTVAIAATGKAGKPREYLLHARNGNVRIQEPGDSAPAAEPDARVSGSHAAWVAALGPGGDRSGLRFEGNLSLAETLLDGISPSKRSNSQAA
jgi:DNA-binding HxlR family transcriptional regulator